MNKKIGNLFKGDKGIWIVFLLLCVISVIEVFSASSTLTYKSGNFLGPMIYHTGTLLVGLVVAIVTLNIPCRFFKLITPVMLILSFGTLLWVLLFGESINGANRVIQLPGFTFQPSELAKGTMVLATAQILSAMQREDGRGADNQAMKYVLVLLLPMLFLIGIENLSTAMLLFIVIFILMFLGRVPIKQLSKLTGVAVLLGALFIAAVFIIGNIEDKKEADALKAEQTEQIVKGDETKQTAQADKPEKKGKGVFHRFATWRNRIISKSAERPKDPKEYVVNDSNFQVSHAYFAIATSGIIGKGPGNSVERDYLPQAFSDFIYAIIIEEMGIIGAVIVVFLYIILLFRAGRIASRCENNFPAFLVMGLSLLLVFQAVINMMVAVGLGPVTGQPLPLISKGGTSTLVNCAYIGAILSVSRSAKKRDVAASLNNSDNEDE